MRKNKKGFTLIEIIVVVVILAVLMAVAVPSVLKYLNTAQEAPALTECHAIVTAAQKRVIEKYSQNHDDEITLDEADNQWIEDFVDKGGSILETDVKNKEVTKILYKASNGLLVLYENNEYKIIDDEEISYFKSAQTMMQLANKLEKENDIKADVNGNNNNGESSKKPGWSYKLQKAFKEQNNGQYPKLNEEEQKTLKDGNYNGDPNALVWKPMYAKDGTVILLADTKGSAGSNALAVMLYYNNQYYVNQFANFGYRTTYVQEATLEFDENGVPINPDDRNFWVKLDK